MQRPNLPVSTQNQTQISRFRFRGSSLLLAFFSGVGGGCG